jgi:hypothetical protein
VLRQVSRGSAPPPSPSNCEGDARGVMLVLPNRDVWTTRSTLRPAATLAVSRNFRCKRANWTHLVVVKTGESC